ncbi:MAG: hypothetical protein GY804_11945, partial [Alphaproteobacteria bacterium]|nr:hypothetical protein [Alphaproteobacteria bacterium]
MEPFYDNMWCSSFNNSSLELENDWNFLSESFDPLLQHESQSENNLYLPEKAPLNVEQLYPPLPTPPTTPPQTYPPLFSSCLLQPITPHIQNVVSTANLQTRLNLNEIAAKACNVHYNPQTFPNGLTLRMRNPRCTAQFFKSGKMVCLGAKSESLSLHAAKHFAKVLEKLGLKIKFSEFKVRNVVGSCETKFPICLQTLHQMHSKNSSYEPEIFPAPKYKMCNPKVTLLIFSTGKIIVT